MKQPYENWLKSISSKLQDWLKKGAEFTKEEGQVLTIRAKEAGHLTALNAKKHKLNREYQELCAQVGQQIMAKGTHKDMLSEPKVQELMSRASRLEKEIKKLEEEIEFCKKECDDQIIQIRKAA